MLPTHLAPFKKELKGLHQVELDLFRELLENVKSRLKSEKGLECWERTFIEEKDKLGLSDDEGAYVVGTLYEAGSSTTAAAMMNVILAMVHYSEWQIKLQQEVDTVVGDDRMPLFEDMERLPKVRAVVKEAMRWRPVTAGGVPHQLDKDDVYEGIFFPKGTNVHPNQWYFKKLGICTTRANQILGQYTAKKRSTQTQKLSTPIDGSHHHFLPIVSHYQCIRISKISRLSVLAAGFVPGSILPSAL